MNVELSNALTKYANKIFLPQYPMLEKIEIAVVDLLIIVKFIVNDPDLTEHNMYRKGLDPHYFIDFKLKEILPYFDNKQMKPFGFVVVGPDGEKIADYAGY